MIAFIVIAVVWGTPSRSRTSIDEVADRLWLAKGGLSSGLQPTHFIANAETTMTREEIEAAVMDIAQTSDLSNSQVADQFNSLYAHPISTGRVRRVRARAYIRAATENATDRKRERNLWAGIRTNKKREYQDRVYRMMEEVVRANGGKNADPNICRAIVINRFKEETGLFIPARHLDVSFSHARSVSF
jgi:hypothetical protein